jgi:hypothetical protein
LDVLDDLLALNMAFINYQEANIWEIGAALQGLGAANLNPLVGAVSPMPRLHDAVRDAILRQASTGLVDQDNPVQNHRYLGSFLGLLHHHVHSNFGLAKTCRSVQELAAVLRETFVELMHNIRLMRS